MVQCQFHLIIMCCYLNCLFNHFNLIVRVINHSIQHFDKFNFPILKVNISNCLHALNSDFDFIHYLFQFQYLPF